MDFALERKEVATRLFKNGRYRLAMERYKKILELFNYMESFKAHAKFGVKGMKGVEAPAWNAFVERALTLLH